jgi:hypothetical protein
MVELSDQGQNQDHAGDELGLEPGDPGALTASSSLKIFCPHPHGDGDHAGYQGRLKQHDAGSADRSTPDVALQR